MTTTMRARWAAVLGGIAMALSPACVAQDAAALRSRHAALGEALARSVFPRPLVLESWHTDGASRGEVSAVVAHPFVPLRELLVQPAAWCDALVLHHNVKGCRSIDAPHDARVSVSIGRKVDQPLVDAYRVDFRFAVADSHADYLRVQLHAPSGPLGTSDYRIDFEATPLDERTSFVHMTYAYRHGALARVAMSTYLATIGRDKVGFTVVGRRSDGQPVHVGGLRGVVERNALRYHYAVEALLATSTLPPAQQPEARLQAWWTLVERHPRQLKEMERDEYLAMKRRELARMQATAAR